MYCRRLLRSLLRWSVGRTDGWMDGWMNQKSQQLFLLNWCLLFFSYIFLVPSVSSSSSFAVGVRSPPSPSSKSYETQKVASQPASQATKQSLSKTKRRFARQTQRPITLPTKVIIIINDTNGMTSAVVTIHRDFKAKFLFEFR